jgi:hypothetical protein
MSRPIVVMLSLFLVAGCHSNNGKGNGNDDLGDLSVAVGDGGDQDLSGAILCGLVGEACAGNSACCSNSCDLTTNICISSTTSCKSAGDTCVVPTDCCNLTCNGGVCAQAGSCIADNAACGTSVIGTCCSGTCGAGNTCTPLNNSCKTAGNPCGISGDAGGNGDCCSGSCKSGVCELAASYCTQVGDICYRAADCCTGVCNIAAGATAGICAQLNSPVSCAIDGTICAGCGSCCSRLCAPFAASGVNICQPASGCHVYGDLCRKDSDCCGGEPTSTNLPGAQLVKCTLIAGTNGIGYCDHPKGSGGGGNACDPEGDVCHFQNYACSNSSDRNDCCACTAGKDCCKLDSLGIPRCNSINPNDGGTCVAAGGDCTFNGECCNSLPCVPNSAGQLTCGVGGGDGGICVPQGGVCTTTGDCCAGQTCVVPPGALAGTCSTVATPPTDAGTPPPVCAEIGQSCATTACCLGLNCTGSMGASCGDTGAGCICTTIIK